MNRRVLLLCGGRSGEHEVSLASAASVLEAVARRVDVIPLVIGRDGRRLAFDEGLRALGAAAGDRDVTPWLPEPPADVVGHDGLVAFDRSSGVAPFDVVFPLLHGPYGEDGTVQGLLELVDVPYVGSGVLGSAVAMDKPTMKDVFGARGFPQVGYRVVTRARFEADPETVARGLDDLAWPRYVKPANLGSSVGIARATTTDALISALSAAFEHDRRAIVEESVEGARELEVAVLGNDDPAASPVGEIRFDGDFYDYDTKYTEGAAQLVIPADVPAAAASRSRPSRRWTRPGSPASTSSGASQRPTAARKARGAAAGPRACC